MKKCFTMFSIFYLMYIITVLGSEEITHPKFTQRPVTPCVAFGHFYAHARYIQVIITQYGSTVYMGMAMGCSAL